MKHTAKLLVVLALILAFCSCSTDPGKVETEPAATTDAPVQSGTETEPEPETRSDVDDIPTDANLNGADFVIFTRTSVPWLNSMFDVEEMTGEPINDAIYERNRSVEARLNTVISEDHFDDVDSRIDEIIMSGETRYGMCAITDRIGYAKILEGYMYDTSDLPYIDLEKQYWQQAVNDAMSIGGKYYLLSGNYNLTTYDYTHALLFNKYLWDILQFDDIYTTVKKGEWTFDAFGTVTAAALTDLNGDGQMDNQDQYGYASVVTEVLPTFWVSAGETIMVKDKDGYIQYNLPGNERFVDVINKTFSITVDNNGTGIGIDWGEFQSGTMFKNNQFLLYNSTFGRIPIMRDMDVDFGIIPYPKYTLEQKQYYSNNDGGKYAFVPSSNVTPVDASMVIEALASTSKKVYTAYYDVSLKAKATRDRESLEMLEIIFDTRVLDLGRTMWQELFVEKMARPMFENNDRNMSSLLASFESMVQEDVKRINESAK
ncbi:MAG: hypothetical protein IKQ92_14200 [Clostridia bacterium]|nr:hypothetical protein [Clostridia bacterium]